MKKEKELYVEFTEGDNRKKELTEVTQTPSEGKWFEVNPKAIDQNLFSKKRNDPVQENTRQNILEAFIEVNNNSEYAKSFKTMIPKRGWSFKTVKELKELANIFGDHNANWVEQALEWAQRIDNGETWESICNEADKSKCYRLVVWKNGEARMIGGASDCCNDAPASYVGETSYDLYDEIVATVPLVAMCH